MELELVKSNNLEIERSQNDFLQSNLGKVINTTLDIGLRYLLPDFIENEVINIKNAFISEGWEKGLNQILQEGINLGKSITGIFTGKFENVNQIKKTVENGGIIDSASDLLDIVLNKCTEKGLINSNVKSIISKGKDVLMSNVSSNIEEMLTKQDNIEQSIKKALNSWQKAYNKQDVDIMDKQYKILEEDIKQLVPLEELINNVRKVENIHNIIKNNGGNFNLTNEQLELAKIL